MKATTWALWEIWIGALIVALGFWLLYPEGIWGVGAAVFALGATILAARTSRPVKVAASVLGLAGSGAALHASWQVAAIENNWEEVRTSLVERATRQLEITLGDAVAIVEALAERGANLQASSRSEMFSMLQGGLAARSPERGVVVFGRTGEPWAWAGNLRIPPVPIGVPLRAQITQFYVVLEAERTRDGQKAVAQLLLAGDSAVPNRDATVGARFARLTGSELRFSAPGPERRGRDFFQYCVPDCNSIDVQPDTLFAVQPVPPTQGTLKLMMLERGGRRVAVALAMTLVVFFVVVGSRLRFWTLAGGAVLLLVTPLGPRLWLEPLFSPRTYFLSSFGLLNTSAGGLVVLAGFMRILDDAFVEHFDGRLLNVHPSLLPKYPGLNTYCRVLAAKDSVHGCSIHFVSSRVDGGPVVAQSEVPIQAGDDEISLSAKVQASEHKLYPMVIGWFARGALRCRRQTIMLDGELLGKPRKIAFTDLDEAQELN